MPAGGGQRVAAVGDDLGLVPGRRQVMDDQAGDVGVVLDDQDAAHDAGLRPDRAAGQAGRLGVGPGGVEVFLAPVRPQGQGAGRRVQLDDDARERVRRDHQPVALEHGLVALHQVRLPPAVAEHQRKQVAQAEDGVILQEREGRGAGVGEHLAAQVVPPAFQGGKVGRPRGIVLEPPIHGQAVLGDQGGDVGVGRGQILDAAQEGALPHLERRGDEAVRAVGGGVEAEGPILGRPADVVPADRLDDAIAGAAPGKPSAAQASARRPARTAWSGWDRQSRRPSVWRTIIGGGTIASSPANGQTGRTRIEAVCSG